MSDVLYEKDGFTACVTLNRPEQRNAVGGRLHQELAERLAEAEADPEVRAVILTGAGPMFCAGIDFQGTLAQGVAAPAASALRMDLRNAPPSLLYRMSTPTVCALNGGAAGFGMDLALACDIRIASANAKLGQPEVNIGIIPGFGGSQRLPRLVGMGRAAEMIYTGDAIDAATAERIGLVNRVVPRERLLDEARALARKILEKSPAAIALAKACLRSAWEMPLSAGLDFETAAFGVVGSTHDKAEGMQAFIEKRRPSWTGA